MKRKWKLTALMLAAAVLLCACQQRELKADEKAWIETKYTTYLNQSGVSGAVYAVYRGETLYEGGAGKATADESNSPDVAYGIASLTKQFTAAAILQLYDAGKLDLSDKLSLYFPDYAYGDEITLRQLLSMRSGIPDYEVENYDGRIIVTCDGTDDAYTEVFTDNTAEENIAIIREFFLSRDLLFEPGERFDYSDANFALLAAIVAQRSGMSYHDYVREHFFTPLGMTNASFIDEEKPAVPLAESDPSEFGIDYYTVSGAEYGCGDALMTPRDLYQWYKGLFGGEVVSARSLRIMTKNNSEKDELGYGLGLMISDEGRCKVAYHYGWIPSYYSAVFYVPDQDFFLTLLSNRSDGGPQGVAAQMVSYFGKTLDLDLKGF